MTQPKALVAVAVLTVGIVGCGNAPSSPSARPAAILRLNVSDPVVGAPSTDTRFAMEATVPMVIAETSGQGYACISYFEFRIDDVATGLPVSPLPVITFADRRFQLDVQPPDFLCFGPDSRIEAPFRVSFSTIGTFRVAVTLTAWTKDSTGPYNSQTRFSGEFRIVPAQ